MAFSIVYKRLLEVSVLHEYFLYAKKENANYVKGYDLLTEEEKTDVLSKYNIHDILEIQPDEATQKLLQAYRMVFSKSPDGFVIGIRSDANDKPSILIDETLVLTFLVTLRAPFFHNYTGLRFLAEKESIYHFSNLTNNYKVYTDPGTNEQNIGNFLTQPILAFDQNQIYQAGDVRVDNVNNPTNIFEAIQDIPAGPFNAALWRPILPDFNTTETYYEGDLVLRNDVLFVATDDALNGAFDPGKWEEIGSLQAYLNQQEYANFRDIIPIRPSSFTIDFSPVTSNNASIELVRPVDGKVVAIYLVEDLNSQKQQFVRFANIPSGRYGLKVKNGSGIEVNTSQSGEFFLNSNKLGAKPFGSIQLTHHPSSTNKWEKWLDNTDKIQTPHPVYTLRFRNRFTFWRCIFNKDIQEMYQEGSASFPGTPGEEQTSFIAESGSLKRFASEELQPLSEAYQAVKTTYITQDNQRVKITLPNPPVNIVKPSKIDQKVYSEIFIQI